MTSEKGSCQSGMPAITVRPAQLPDAPRLLEMMRTLADYERSPGAMLATLASLQRDGFGHAPRFRALLAMVAGEAIGYVSYTTGYSAWRGSSVLLVDDLFVQADHRKAGVGQRLMEHVGRVCLQEGHAHVRWTVETGNSAAIGFYTRLGARIEPKGVCTWRP